MAIRRSFLFLQGPHGRFFYELGNALKKQGFAVTRVNISGGDWWDWKTDAINYHGRGSDWAMWIGNLMQERRVTDVLMFGDWRPYHRDAIHIASLHGIRVWAFDEGYLRPYWITIEEGGVNGNSSLYHDPDVIHERVKTMGRGDCPVDVTGPMLNRQWDAFIYSACSVLAFPFFPFYRTHRPYSVLKELVSGWIPRILTSSNRKKRTKEALCRIGESPYFLFPLQLDSDSQVRRYSPFSGMKEAIGWMLTSFAKSAPQNVHLIIKNHPLDNGMIRYDRYIRSFAKACGIEDRVVFIEGGNGKELMSNSIGVVLLNSTMGLQALQLGKPVYCVGRSIYAMPGMAQNKDTMKLDDFWHHPIGPKKNVVDDFVIMLHHEAVVNGNFYTKYGVKIGVENCLQRLKFKGK